jgi:hypothetical protein
MTEAAMRAVVAMAVCFFLFNDNSERGTLVSYVHISSACSLSLSLCLRECLRASRTRKGERERRDNQENKNLSASRKERASALSEAHAKDTTRTTLRLALEHIPRDAIIAQNRSKRATVRARALAHSARTANPSRNN